MKKLLSIILVFTMLMSVCVVNTYAYTDYQTVWTQTFESATSSDYAAGGTSTGTFLQNNAPNYIDGAQSKKVLVARRKAGATGVEQVIAKVFLDNTVLEEGATYKITAYVMHANSAGAKSIVVKPLKDTGTTAYLGSATRTIASVPEKMWMTVSSNEFVYNASNIASGGSLNVRFELSGGENVTDTQRFYIDDVKLIKVIDATDTKPTSEASVFASYNLGETLDFEDATYTTLRGYSNSATVYDVDANGGKYIVNDPVGAGQGKVLRGAGYKNRNELYNILSCESTTAGKTYTISYKMYVEGTSDLDIRTGLKTTISASADGGKKSAVYLKKGVDFNEGVWNDIEFNITIPSTATGAKNLFFDQRNDAGTSFEGGYQYIYVDDIKIIETPSMFMGAGRNEVIDFENTRDLIKGVDWTGNITGDVSVVSNSEKGIGTEGKSLLINAPGTNATATRVSLLDMFEDSDIGKKTKISFKIYPKGEESEKGIRFGAKYTTKDDKTMNSYWGSNKYYPVGEDSALKPNTWNNVSVYLDIKTNTGLTAAFAIDQRDSSVVINDIYIDDIKIEETGTSYFEDAVTDGYATLDFEEGAENILTLNEDWTSGGAFGGHVFYSTKQVHGGSYSLKIDGIEQLQHRLKLRDALKNATVGNTYKLGAWFYGENEGKVSFGIISDETKETRTAKTIDLPAGTWTYGEYIFTMGKDSSGNLKDEIMFDQLMDDDTGTNAPYNTALYVDDITVEPVDVANSVAYVSNAGNDANSGLSESAPLKSLKAAFKLPVSKIVLLDDMTYEDAEKERGSFTITGKTSSVVLTLPESTDIMGNTKFENLVLKGTATVALSSTSSVDNSASIFANGHTLEIADTVTSYNDSANSIESRFVVYGGKNNATVASTDVRIYGGKYARIFGGGFNTSGKVTGNTNVIVGGNVNSTDTANAVECRIFGGGRSAAVTGSTNITFTGNAVTKYIVGAGQFAGGTTPETNITISGGKVMNVYAGSTSAEITSNTNVTMTGGIVEAIFGGSENYAMTGNTVINLLGGEVTRRVYGGCYNEFDYKIISATWGGSDCVTGTTNIVIGPNVSLNTKNGLSGISDTTNVGVFAGSRTESNSASEVSTIIFISDAYDTKSNVIGEKGSLAASYFKSHTDYIVDVSVGGSVVPSTVGGTITLVPDAGRYAVVNGKGVYVGENNVALNGGTNTVAFTSGNIIASADVNTNDTGAKANVTCVVEESAKLVVAIYSSESEMVAAKAVDATSNKTSYEVDVDFDSLNATGCNAKVMLWDNLNIPLADLLETTVK